MAQHTVRKVLVGAALLAGSLLTFGTAAQAADAADVASCKGAGCNGKDPIATGCNIDAETREMKVVVFYGPDEAAHGRMIIRSRWSPTCHASWSMVRVLNKDATIGRVSAYLGLPDNAGARGRNGAGDVLSTMMAGQLGACGRAVVTLDEGGTAVFKDCTSVG